MKQNESLRIRRIKTYGTRAFVAAILLLCGLILVNTVLCLLPAKVTKFDTTGTGLTEIPAEGEKFLSELDTDVTIYWLCEDGKVNPQIIGEWFDLLLTRYEEANDHLKIERVSDEEMLASMEEIGLVNHDLIIRSDKRTTAISSADLFTYSSLYINNNMANGQEIEMTLEQMASYRDSIYSQSYGQVDILSTVYNHSSIANARILSAIDYVTADTIPHPYLLTGFDGAELSASLKKTLEEEYPDLEELDIRRVDAIPADAGCVILHAPTTDLGERETALLSAYFSRGGSMVLTTSPATWEKECPNLQSLLTPFGLSPQPGIVFETKESNYTSSTDTLVPNVYAQHSLYNIYQQNKSHRMPWSHAIAIAKDATAAPLFYTSDGAVRKPAGGTSETLGEPARHYVAVEAIYETQASANGTAANAHILWFGSADAFSDATLAAATANTSYLIGGIDLVSGTFASPHDTLPGVRVATQPLDSMGNVLGIIVMITITVLIPAGLLVTGTVIWIKRRRRH